MDPIEPKLLSAVRARGNMILEQLDMANDTATYAVEAAQAGYFAEAAQAQYFAEVAQELYFMDLAQAEYWASVQMLAAQPQLAVPSPPAEWVPTLELAHIPPPPPSASASADMLSTTCTLQAGQTLEACSDPVLGSPELPTVGSAGHCSGTCKPCAFMHSKGCSSGVQCSFCHLCFPGEKKRRKKERSSQRMQQVHKEPVQTSSISDSIPASRDLGAPLAPR